jgi:hypothetical protein
MINDSVGTGITLLHTTPVYGIMRSSTFNNKTKAVSQTLILAPCCTRGSPLPKNQYPIRYNNAKYTEALITAPRRQKLRDQYIESLRNYHYFLRTEYTYILYHNRRHPPEMGEVEINEAPLNSFFRHSLILSYWTLYASMLADFESMQSKTISQLVNPLIKE